MPTILLGGNNSKDQCLWFHHDLRKILESDPVICRQFERMFLLSVKRFLNHKKDWGDIDKKFPTRPEGKDFHFFQSRVRRLIGKEQSNQSTWCDWCKVHWKRIARNCSCTQRRIINKEDDPYFGIPVKNKKLNNNVKIKNETMNKESNSKNEKVQITAKKKNESTSNAGEGRARKVY